MGLIIEVNSVTDHSFINLSNYTATIKSTINACEQDQDPNLIANNPNFGSLNARAVRLVSD